MFYVQGEVLFNSWRDLFTGAGAPFPFPPRIYSFDGRNVLSDNSWYKINFQFGKKKLIYLISQATETSMAWGNQAWRTGLRKLL